MSGSGWFVIVENGVPGEPVYVEPDPTHDVPLMCPACLGIPHRQAACQTCHGAGTVRTSI